MAQESSLDSPSIAPDSQIGASANPSLKSDRLTQLVKLRKAVGRKSTKIAVIPDLWAPPDANRDPALWQALENWRRKMPAHRRDSSMETQIVFWLRHLGEKTKMSAVTELQVRRLADALPISNGAKNRYVSALGSLYKHARGPQALNYDGVSPTKGVRYDELSGRVSKTALTQLEIDGLLAAASASAWPKLRLFILIGLTTGMRRSNILWLRWRDIDEEAGLISAGSKPGREDGPTKNGTRFTTILNPEVAKESARFRTEPADLLFENTFYNGKPFALDKHFKEAVRRAGLNPRISPHWLRHTAATIAARNGASTSKLMRAMNWKSEQMAKIYVHLNVEDIRDVAGALGRAVKVNPRS